MTRRGWDLTGVDPSAEGIGASSNSVWSVEFLLLGTSMLSTAQKHLQLESLARRE
jgi:hypothetical protein